MKNELTYERANELLRYEQETGKLFWRVRRGGTAKAGDEAGHARQKADKRTPYRYIRIDGKEYGAHRVAWLLHYGEWPEHEIDHLDGYGLNNRPGNMRDVPKSVNQRNARKRRDNSSGVTGVCWSKQIGKWHARVRVDGEIKSLGHFTDIADAEAAVRDFRAKHGFTERHGADV